MIWRTLGLLFVLNIWISTAHNFNLNEKSIKELKAQIREELTASRCYQLLSHYFESTTYAYHGTAKFFNEMSYEEKGHADKLMTYMNKRLVAANNDDDKKESITCEKFYNEINLNLLKGWTIALDLETDIYNKLVGIVKNVNVNEEMKHFIEHEFLDEQIESRKQISDYVTQLKNLDQDNVGYYLFDNNLLHRNEKCSS